MLVLLDSKSRITICPPLSAQASAASSGPPLSQNTEHILQARARLIAQYVGKPRIDEILCIYVDQIQLLENALWQLATLRTIDTGEGIQLDGIGDIVGQERQGLSDADYKPLLRARIKANNSEGTGPDILAVADAALNEPGPGSIRFDPKPPASYELTFTEPIPFADEIMTGLIFEATAAGVRAIVIVTYLASTAVFTLGTVDNEFDTSKGLGSTTTPSVGGGGFTHAIEEG